MIAEIEDWKNNWYGISIGIAKEEIDEFIDLLKMLKNDPDQHFHVSSDCKGSGGVGSIEVYVKTSEEKDNLSLSGKALAPGEKI